MFTVNHQHAGTHARAGTLVTPHGTIRTPFFMPIATQGVVKTLSLPELFSLEQTLDPDTTPIVLSNTYHLYLRPGEEKLKFFGGIHGFGKWKGIVLTDSGGFQIFSLKNLRTLSDEGAEFRSHLDGSSHLLTPERSMEIQSAIASDIWMAFDYFPGFPATEAEVKRSVELTTAWAARCSAWHAEYWKEKSVEDRSLLFGIVQGGVFPDMRKQSAEELGALNCSGYAVGGLAVGEPQEVMYEVLEHTTPHLPIDKPRYLMGVGTPDQILEAVKRGVDMFDCVMPTRNARHGTLFVRTGKNMINGNLESVAYEKMNMRAERFAHDTEVLDPWCSCFTCTSGFSRGYLRHLFVIQDPTAARLATLHNITFYLTLMKEMRDFLASA